MKMVTVMLVTSLYWGLYDGDRFQMLVAESLYWRLFSLCWWVSQCIKSVTNILNRSPTSQTCHQHIWPLTSVTNIDVTDENWCKVVKIFLRVLRLLKPLKKSSKSVTSLPFCLILLGLIPLLRQISSSDSPTTDDDDVRVGDIWSSNKFSVIFK